MALSNRIRIRWMASAFVLLAIIIAYPYILSWTYIPAPETSTHMVPMEGFTSFVVSPKYVQRHKAYSMSSRSRRFPPNHVNYTVKSGTVEVCVVPCNIGYRAKDANDIKAWIQQFAEGQVPKETVARFSESSGTINLRDAVSEKKQQSYLVLVRGEVGSEVTLVIHYGL